MDSLLHKFSLQNLLRQFFCGVVFFVPPWLFARTQLLQVFGVEQGNAGMYLIFGALASIIGTVIYHIEKNLYSYSIQTLFEACSKYRNWHMRVVPLLVAGAITLAVSPLFYIPQREEIFDCFMVALIFFVVMWIFNVLFTDSFVKVMRRTRACWFIEEQTVDNGSEDMFARRSVAKRISSWSDFIHCTQSCCFAWLLGCASCKFVAKGSAELHEPFFWCSIVVTFFILFLEIIFDWHRYQHVIAITETDLLGDIYREYPQLKTRYNAVSNACEILVETTVKSKKCNCDSDK